ncbi:hypothetical protein ICE98_00184 [Lactococcus lactis]|nr:hypothetical protein [Lactococcus lactis]
MNKDEQLVVQVLNAYKNGKIDFSHVPELETLVRQEVNKEFRDYQEKIEAVASQKMESAIQEQLHRLEAENLKADILKEIQDEKQELITLKKELNEHQEQIKVDRKHAICRTLQYFDCEYYLPVLFLSCRYSHRTMDL